MLPLSTAPSPPSHPPTASASNPSAVITLISPAASTTSTTSTHIARHVEAHLVVTSRRWAIMAAIAPTPVPSCESAIPPRTHRAIGPAPPTHLLPSVPTIHRSANLALH